MEEKRMKKRIFGPVLDVLPKSYQHFPVLFNEDELSYLKGSPLLDAIHSEKEALRKNYLFICHCVPQFKQFPLEEYIEQALITGSRIFAPKMHGLKTKMLVPFADMLNHSPIC